MRIGWVFRKTLWCQVKPRENKHCDIIEGTQKIFVSPDKETSISIDHEHRNSLDY